MALILSIETATNICSVGLGKDGVLLSKFELSEQNAHSSQLTILIEKLFKEQSISAFDVDAFAISKGPGSYTGLRIGTSVAKGLCYATDKPLITVDTLQALTIAAINSLNQAIDETTFFAPFLDARRMEVYTALFDKNLLTKKEVCSMVVTEESFHEYLDTNKIYIFGNGALKCKPIITNKNAIFIDNIELSSEWLMPLAENMFLQNEFADVAYFQPFYLKEFQATIPKKNIFN